MDPLWNTNVNAEMGNPCSRRREMQTSENIYENVLNCSLVPITTEPALSGVTDVKRSSCGASALFLGLLCLLLIAGLILLIFISYTVTKDNSEWEKEMTLLHHKYNNLTKERDALQTRYNNLISAKKQIHNNTNDPVRMQQGN